MRGAGVATLLLAAFAASCVDRMAPAPQSTPRPAGDKLRPLTSRDTGGADTPSFAPEAQATLPPGHPQVDAGPAQAQPLPGDAVSGTISLVSTLSGRHSSADALFIIARRSSDKQIVAVRKEESVRFPFAFRISGADAMVAGTPFTGPFDITARLSKSGDAMPARGDVEGTTRGIALGAKDAAITLDRVRQ